MEMLGTLLALRVISPRVNYVALGAKPWRPLQPLCPNALTGPEQ